MVALPRARILNRAHFLARSRPSRRKDDLRPAASVLTRCGLRDAPERRIGRSMLTRVAEAEAVARFAELLERAQAGETILVERDGVPVCRLGPPGPACTLDAFTRFLERIHAQGGVREVTYSPQRLA